jgi:anaerobic ribonucleoside-triphosphate reductase
MRTIEEIDKEIKALEEKFAQTEGRPAEVYSRIVGYYRDTRAWNPGKAQEFTERKTFDPEKFKLNKKSMKERKP